MNLAVTASRLWANVCIFLSCLWGLYVMMTLVLYVLMKQTIICLVYLELQQDTRSIDKIQRRSEM